jgi:quinolinate synthase
MYATYHLKADELNADVVQSLKNAYHEDEIVILPKTEYEEMEKARHNAAYTEKLLNSMKELEDGNVIIKTIAELRAMENE